MKMMAELSPSTVGMGVREQADPICRVAVLGHTGVGKTGTCVSNSLIPHIV